MNNIGPKIYWISKINIYFIEMYNPWKFICNKYSLFFSFILGKFDTFVGLYKLYTPWKYLWALLVSIIMNQKGTKKISKINYREEK